MKIRDLALIFIVSTIFGAIYADQVVMIKNEYKDPIVVMINGRDAALIQPMKEERLYTLPEKIQIRRQKAGSIAHSGIQKEVDKIRDASLVHPNLYATITILSTSGLFNFNYHTKMQTTPSRPSQGPVAALWQQIFDAFKNYKNDLAINLLKRAVIELKLCGPVIAQQLYIMTQVIYTGTQSPLKGIIDSFSNKIMRNELDFATFKKEVGSTINLKFNIMRLRQIPGGKIDFPKGIGPNGQNITIDYLDSLQFNINDDCPCKLE